MSNAPFDPHETATPDDWSQRTGVRSSRRDFLKSGAVGLAGTVGAVACRASGGGTAPSTTSQAPVADLRSAPPRELQNLVGDARKRRILLRGGVVLTLDRNVGDFARADVLIDGKTISAIAPEIRSRRCRSHRLLGNDCDARIHHNPQPSVRSDSAEPHSGRDSRRRVAARNCTGRSWTEHLDGRQDCHAWESRHRRLGPGAGAVRPRRLLHRPAALVSEPDH